MAHTSFAGLPMRSFTCSNCGITEYGLCAPKGWYLGADGKEACSRRCARASHYRWLQQLAEQARAEEEARS